MTSREGLRGFRILVFMRQLLIVKDHVKQGFMNADATVVVNEAALAKAVHEETDAGASGADHLRECFLRDLRDQSFRLSRFAELGHQQENSGEALFAGIEKLIYKIGLGAHAASEQKLEEEIGERMLFVHYADHLLPFDFQRRAGVDGAGRGQPQSGDTCDGFLSYEIPGGEKRNGGFFSVF